MCEIIYAQLVNPTPDCEDGKSGKNCRKIKIAVAKIVLKNVM